MTVSTFSLFPLLCDFLVVVALRWASRHVFDVSNVRGRLHSLPANTSVGDAERSRMPSFRSSFGGIAASTFSTL